MAADADAALHVPFQGGEDVVIGKAHAGELGQDEADHQRWPAEQGRGAAKVRADLAEQGGDQADMAVPANSGGVDGQQAVDGFFILPALQVRLEGDVLGRTAAVEQGDGAEVALVVQAEVDDRT